MDVYLAESGRLFNIIHQRGRSFRGLNILQSYWYCRQWYTELTENVIIKQAGKFMLDSGAFTFFQDTRHHVDWNAWVDDYAEFINRNDVKLFFELDIDSIVGYDNVLKLRSRLEAQTGRKCIPVWHSNRGRDEFLKMCDEYDYVALGGLVNADVPRARFVKVMPWFANEAHKRGAKIHGLGFTDIGNLRRIRFDSVDSTSWCSSARYGTLMTFDGRGIVADKREGKRVKDYKEAAAYNFDEWVKFAKYASTHL